ncbi:MAG: ABC transporter permease [Ruminococcaceae bacterium]|nr:ABC transporter permease [Oscillospiraceae bacterium]
MVKYIFKRLGYMLLVALILTFLMFCIYNLIPNDRAGAEAENYLKANKNMVHIISYDELREQYSRQFGTDGNIVQRYLRWMGLYPYTPVHEGDPQVWKGLLTGYLGYSYKEAKPVVDVLITPLKNTVFINIFATVLALGITIPLGIFCAVKKGSKRDTAVQIGTIIGYSLPAFITAILFIFVFAVLLGWFPLSGMKTLNADYTGFRLFLDKMYHLALPLIVMTFTSLGGMTRYVRASMVDALSMDCIRTARAKGVREKAVIYSHAFRNALIPIVTLVIGWFLGIFSGSIMIENIFAINGIGRTYILALQGNDFEVVLALQMFYVLISLAGNLITDLVYGFVDPRIRVNK